MKSLVIHPRNKKEFDSALSSLPEFGRGRNLLTLEDDDSICFVFLMKAKDAAEETSVSSAIKKPAH